MGAWAVDIPIIRYRVFLTRPPIHRGISPQRSPISIPWRIIFLCRTPNCLQFLFYNNPTRIYIQGINSLHQVRVKGNLNNRKRMYRMNILTFISIVVIYILVSIEIDGLSAQILFQVVTRKLLWLKATININLTPTNLS